MESKEKDRLPPNGIMSFTLFVILPTEDVCSLRNLASGVTIRELRCRLELMAGIPAQIYRLVCSDDVALHEEHRLVLDKNVWDGFIVRIQLHDSWLRLFKAVLADDVDHVIHHGAVNFQNQKVANPDEEGKFKDIMQERGFVSLFIASYYGHLKMCQTLLSLGVSVNGRTPFKRTPLHAAVSRDQDHVMDVLIQHGGSVEVKDAVGDTVEIVARKCFAKQCVRKLRVLKLQGSTTNGYVSLNGTSSVSSNRKIKPLHPSPPAQQPPSRPTTSNNKARLIKRHTVASVNLQSVPLPVGGDKEEVTSSHQHFMWDTDTRDGRSSSASRYRLGPPSNNHVMPRIGTASSKYSVSWDDSTPRTPGRHTPNRHGSLPQKQSILKNKGENFATVPPRKSVSRGYSSTIHMSSPPRAPSEHGSQLSIASAPGMGQDFSGGNNSDARSVESAPELQDDSQSAVSSRKDSSKRPRTRLLVSRTRTNESWRTMKRRIQMAESKKKMAGDDKQKTKETFDEWLNRKRKQEKRDSRESDSEDSVDSDNEGGNSQAYNTWLKEQRARQIVRPQTVTVADLYRRRTRPLKGLVTVTDHIDVPLDHNENMAAHRKWRERVSGGGEEEQRTGLDEEKKKVEEKRQSLLARAVSYDEWMVHTEDRKRLMQRILEANMAELQKIEEEKLQKRVSRQVSYPQWRDKVEKQETVDRTRRERQRIKQEEEDKRRGDVRNSACVPHDVWMKKKEEENKMRMEKEKENVRKVKVRANEEKSAAFDAWLERKHKQDLAEIQTQIKRERDMIKVLRDRRLASVSTC
ncbi:protein phosphatase 1 regulatory subunit 12A-like [Haliotis rufescens]|uniref:protein phosphatase 1 regulatory subunit 12A-like n=1 Tax=Haliotis rufescens TaxID=6454 RepID=UPI00201EF66B|nr:protein phosphatase 1 regulatory subunit 12A-like [Haliotis rufescens]XP_048253654.1 protein phosphatase 1 regulatory subunit 12A-like [Haliotis rufescens]XP_048253655.1 protein phosphatase 1 regulatory subunit 12A-like [Haliotis rufescens]